MRGLAESAAWWPLMAGERQGKGAGKGKGVRGSRLSSLPCFLLESIHVFLFFVSPSKTSLQTRILQLQLCSNEFRIKKSCRYCKSNILTFLVFMVEIHKVNWGPIWGYWRSARLPQVPSKLKQKDREVEKSLLSEQWQCGSWEHGDEFRHRSPSWNQHQTLIDCLCCYIYCAQRWPPWATIVGASQAVSNRDHLYWIYSTSRSFHLGGFWLRGGGGGGLKMWLVTWRQLV